MPGELVPVRLKHKADNIGVKISSSCMAKHSRTGLEPADEGWWAEMKELACVVQDSMAQNSMLVVQEAIIVGRVVALLEQQDLWVEQMEEQMDSMDKR
jgi:hypothetical protein